jgi:hypothetical protein
MVSPSPSRTAAMRALVSASRPAVCCQSARTRSARPERTSMMQGHAVRVSRRGEHSADRQHSAPARRPAVDTMSWIEMVCPQVARSVAPRPRHSRTCDPKSGVRHRHYGVTGMWAARMAVARGLTALVVGVTKCADNISGQSSKRSHGAAQGQVHKGHRRLRNGRDGGGRRDVSAYIGIQTGSFPRRGPAVRSGPFPVHLSELIEPLSCSPRNPRLHGLCATRQGHDFSV